MKLPPDTPALYKPPKLVGIPVEHGGVAGLKIVGLNPRDEGVRSFAILFLLRVFQENR
jgi:hypothetical protein